MARLSRWQAFFRRNGWYACTRIRQMARERLLLRYHLGWRRERPDALALQAQRARAPWDGLISVVVPVYNTRPAYLRALADSLLAQTYVRWEACLYDGHSTDPATIAALNALAGMDERLRVCHGAENGGISRNTNAAFAMSEGEYIALCDHDDVLSPDALFRLAQAIASSHPEMLYSDEDKLTPGGRIHMEPHDKPDFCPDTLRSGNYICHLMAVRRDAWVAAGGMNPAMDGSQDHDLALRISERAERIVHLPYTLYHWRTVRTSMSHRQLQKCLQAASRAVEAQMGRMGYPGTCTEEAGVLRLRYEVNPALTVETIRFPSSAPYEAINRAAARSTADVLLLMADTVFRPSEDFVRELLMYAQREDVGAVTPMLTDRRGRVTHAGFALDDTAGVRGRNTGLPGHSGGWHGLNRTSHNVAALSAACFMVRRDHFIPFDEAYTDGFGAVDWCLQLARQGLHHVYTPHATAMCEDERLLRPRSDLPRFRSAWGTPHDPCYSPRHRTDPADFERRKKAERK